MEGGMLYRVYALFLLIFPVFYTHANEGDNDVYSYGFCFKVDNKTLDALNFRGLNDNKNNKGEVYLLMLQNNEDVNFSGENLSYASAILYVLNGKEHKFKGVVYSTIKQNNILDSVLYISEDNTDKSYLHGLFYMPASDNGDVLYNEVIYISLLGKVFHLSNNSGNKKKCISKFPPSIVKGIIYP